MENLDIKKEILTSFHSQFAENQNHHQAVFIQFISAVIIVIVGYAIVYTNISNDAQFYFVTKDENQNICSYAIIHLIGSFLIAENILALVNIMTINIGYGFRRDQKVVYNIRKVYLEENEYNKIFGNQSFNPEGKGLFKFLPEFNFIFVVSIFIIQGFLVFSILYALNQFHNFRLFDNICLSAVLITIIFAPIITSTIFYYRYYTKYKTVTGQ